MLSGVPAQKVLLGMGRARAVGLINTAEGLLNLTISIVLVSAYGAIGAALGTLISSYLIGPANFPLACRATAYPLGQFARKSLVPALVSSLPSAIAMLAVWLLMGPSAGRLVIGAFLGIGVAALIGLLQLGPSRALSEIRSELRGGGPEPATSTLVAQDPA
jgi:O-antigen/teichoic acid export membrane protein